MTLSINIPAALINLISILILSIKHFMKMPSKPHGLLFQIMLPPKQINLEGLGAIETRGIKTGRETAPPGHATARVWNHKFLIRSIIMTSLHIGMLVPKPVIIGTNMKPGYIISRARLFSGILTQAAIPLELTGIILTTGRLLLLR